ncbi:hypothetical protein QE152_g37134 [Popillia japonica]|uniref:Uncharacterized protein n=1 Tax=Popillia japonica TaxID=7064 RepID=A0AAW1IBI9_POPJA
MDPENNYTNSLFVSDEDSRLLYSNDNDCGSALHAIQNNFSENEDIEPMEINRAGKAKSFWGYNKTVSLIHAIEDIEPMEINRADKEDDAESSATDGNEENNNELMNTSRQLAKKNKYSTIKAQYLQGKIEYKKLKLLLEERKVNALEELK